MKAKQIIYIVLLFTFFINCNDKVEVKDIEAEKVKVQNTLTSYFNSLAQRDWDGIRAKSTTDFILLENGLVWNNDSLINAMELYWSGAEISYSFDFEKTEVDDSLAWIFYHNYGTVITDTTEIKFHWVESANFIKEDGKWKACFAHSTMVGQPKVTKRE